MEKTRDNGYKLFLKRFQLDTFVKRTISLWNNLPREAVGFPNIEDF